MTHTLEYKGYQGSVDISLEDSCLYGQIQHIEDTIMYDGTDVPSITAAFHDAVDAYIAFCEERGAAPAKPYRGTFNVRIGPELHRKLALAASKNGMKMNEYLKKLLKSALEEPGTATARSQEIDVLNIATFSAMLRDGTPTTARRHAQQTTSTQSWNIEGHQPLQIDEMKWLTVKH